MRRFLNRIFGRFSKPKRAYVVWQPANVYKTAVIGENVSIGMFTEVGPDVRIGENTRIGKGCFIPKGVDIGRNCFIGPHCCFTNDMYPPSPKEEWLSTVISDYAAIGANCTILPGIKIGKGALVGAGSVVTKSIPDSEVWCGVPAKRIRTKRRNRNDES